MITPARAAVRPRVVLPETGDTIPLDDLLSDFRGRPGEGLAIVGGIGSGKTVALAHAAACPGEDRNTTFLDEPSLAEITAALSTGPAVVALRELPANCPCQCYSLARWTNDDLVEYLLARHPQRCGSVMQRLAGSSDQVMRGNPEICRAVLDRMAADESVVTVGNALRRVIQDGLATAKMLTVAREFALASLACDLAVGSKALKKLRAGATSGLAFRLLRHATVLLLLAADGLASFVEVGMQCAWLERRLPRELIALAGSLLSPAAIEYLGREIRRWHKSRHAMAASLLHATGHGWVPEQGFRYDLTGAYLDGAHWAGLSLDRPQLDNCSLKDSDLSRLLLDKASVKNAKLARCVLHEATLIELQASWAEFQKVDLSLVKASYAQLEGADFTNADLHGASLQGSVLRRAVLKGACFDNANLSKANLRGATIEDTSFQRANFEQADLTELPLRKSNIKGANFVLARMSMCDLEDADAPGVNFRRADLFGANFTSARMPGANFSNAILKGAKLGDVNFEGANLTHANLSQCTFHFGSSRSGLVGSTIAGEGSRTGFYTDDFDQQTYRPPEEIRKANLCGADLTGANLKDTDFYLVDLRRATYTPDQLEHLRRCGAILFDRE